MTKNDKKNNKNDKKLKKNEKNNIFHIYHIVLQCYNIINPSADFCPILSRSQNIVGRLDLAGQSRGNLF